MAAITVVLARYSAELFGAGLLDKASCVCWGAALAFGPKLVAAALGCLEPAAAAQAGLALGGMVLPAAA